MKASKPLTTLIIFLLYSHFSFGQNPSITITDIQKKEFRGVSAITNQLTKKIEGYYSLYLNEKGGKKSSEFILSVFDTNLKLIKEIPLSMDRSSTVQSSVYNGEAILFVFNGTFSSRPLILSNYPNSAVIFGKRSITYLSISKTGELLGAKGIELKRKETLTDISAEVYAAKGDGFYIYRPLIVKTNSSWGYSIEKVDNKLNHLWERQFIPEKKGFISPESIETVGDQLLLTQLFRKSYITMKAEMKIIALNSSDGKTNFDYPLYDENIKMSPTCFYAEDSVVICSGIYNEGKTINYRTSDGIFFLKLNEKGVQQEFALIDWKDSLPNILKSTKKTFSFGSKPMVLFHQILKSEEGEYQLIGETFKISSGAISLKLAPKRIIGNPNASYSTKPSTTTRTTTSVENNRVVTKTTTTMNPSSRSSNPSVDWIVEDFIIFTFNDKGSITNINKIEKDHTTFTLYLSFLKGSISITGMFNKLKKEHVFDYAFTTKNATNEDIIISKNFAKKEPYIGIFSLKKGEPSQMNKIEVENKPTKQSNNTTKDFVGVLPGGPGLICIYYFNAKEQTINMYLEDIKLD